MTQRLVSLRLTSERQKTVSERISKDEESPVRKMTSLQNNVSKTCLHHFTHGSCHMPGARFESRHLSRRFQSQTANGANTAGVSELPLPLSGDSDDNPSTPIDYLHHHPVETQRASHYPRVNASEPNENSAPANKQEKTRHLRAAEPPTEGLMAEFPTPADGEVINVNKCTNLLTDSNIISQTNGNFFPKIPILSQTQDHVPHNNCRPSTQQSEKWAHVVLDSHFNKWSPFPLSN